MNKKPQNISIIINNNIFLSKLSRQKLLEICTLSVISKIFPLNKLNKKITIRLVDNNLFVSANSSALRHSLCANKNLILNKINDNEFIKDNPIAKIYF